MSSEVNLAKKTVEVVNKIPHLADSISNVADVFEEAAEGLREEYQKINLGKLEMLISRLEQDSERGGHLEILQPIMASINVLDQETLSLISAFSQIDLLQKNLKSFAQSVALLSDIIPVLEKMESEDITIKELKEVLAKFFE